MSIERLPLSQEPDLDDDDASQAANLPFDEAVRVLEAALFASDAPIGAERITELVGPDHDAVLAHLTDRYAAGGVQLVKLAAGYALRTAPDLDHLFEEQASEPRKLSRAALETLAIIAYHQPVTRAEIEDIRGVSANKGTLDVLMETGWVRMRGRRRTPGRPVTYGTTPAFLDQFTLASLADLPGLDELKGAGLLKAIPDGAAQALPNAAADRLSADEDPLDAEDEREARAALSLWPEREEPDETDEDAVKRGGADG